MQKAVLILTGETAHFTPYCSSPLVCRVHSCIFKAKRTRGEDFPRDKLHATELVMSYGPQGWKGYMLKREEFLFTQHADYLKKNPDNKGHNKTAVQYF